MSQKSNFARWGLRLAGILLVAFAGLSAYELLPRASPRELLQNARRALSKRDFAEAETLALKVPAGAREYDDALLVAGEAATRQNHYEEAIAHYAKIPAGESDQAVTATYCTGDLLFQLGDASAAERQYRRVLAVRPGDRWTHEQLASLLGTFGRRWESIPHLFELLRSQHISGEQLLLLGDPEVGVELNPAVLEFHCRAPSDRMQHGAH